MSTTVTTTEWALQFSDKTETVIGKSSPRKMKRMQEDYELASQGRRPASTIVARTITTVTSDWITVEIDADTGRPVDPADEPIAEESVIVELVPANEPTRALLEEQTEDKPKPRGRAANTAAKPVAPTE